jgi:hypothetical protein
MDMYSLCLMKWRFIGKEGVDGQRHCEDFVDRIGRGSEDWRVVAIRRAAMMESVIVRRIGKDLGREDISAILVGSGWDDSVE